MNQHQFFTGEIFDAYRWFGAHIEQNAVVFRTFAPNASRITLTGACNGWNETDLVQDGRSGFWSVSVPDARAGQFYKYRIYGPDGSVTEHCDPYGFAMELRPACCSIITDLEEYRFTDEAWMNSRTASPDAPLNIYEMHLGSWKTEPDGSVNYVKAAHELAGYCTDMGYTHIELLPLTEYPFPGSWGYQVTGYYAPTARYGTPDEFAEFVDILHNAGIGVIMDWVPAHFPRDEHGLALFDGTRLFECKEKRMADHPEWGTLIFDYAMPEVQSFLISSACCFFENYHIDGIRVDAVSSMLYLNYGRKDGEYTPNAEGGNINLAAVEFLRKLNTAVLSEYPGAITVAEESTAYPMVTMPPKVGGLGFSFKWDMGYMHDTLDYFATDPLFRSGKHDKLTFSMMYAFSENFILAYSHDEVVHGKKSMLDKMFGSYEQKFATLRSLYGYQFAHPGKKLCFMGSEFGQFIEWNYEQSLDWLLLDYPMHEKLREYYRALNKLYTSCPALYDCDKSWDGFKWLNVNDKDRSSIAFLRSARPENASYLICACNFIPNEHRGFVIGLPENGVLREVLSSDDVRFGGRGLHNAEPIKSRSEPFCDLPYSAQIDLPPLSTVYFEYIPERMSDKNEEGV